MLNRTIRFAAPLAVVAAIVSWSVPTATQGTTKSVFVSVADASGKPIKGMTAADFRIAEDEAGKLVERPVVDVKPATQPIYISMLADTTKNAGGASITGSQSSARGNSDLIRDIRVSLTAFARHIGAASPQSKMALMEFGQASIPIVEFTSNVTDVEKGITKLFPKPDAASVLLEALLESAKNLAKVESPRRAIIILNIEPGDEQSRERPEKIAEQLQAAGASIWAVSLQRGTLRNPTRDIVLNGITKNSGGKRDFIVGQSAIEDILKGYADLLTSQYEIQYTRPAGAKSQTVAMAVANQAPGAVMYAARFAPK